MDDPEGGTGPHHKRKLFLLEIMYHFRHTWLYCERALRGICDNSFKWPLEMALNRQWEDKDPKCQWNEFC